MPESEPERSAWVEQRLAQRQPAGNSELDELRKLDLQTKIQYRLKRIADADLALQIKQATLVKADDAAREISAVCLTVRQRLDNLVTLADRLANLSAEAIADQLAAWRDDTLLLLSEEELAHGQNPD